MIIEVNAIVNKFLIRMNCFNCCFFLLQMCTPAKLRIVFEENDIHKLVLPSGIPSTLQDLKHIIKETF
ncbi:hypothetical protein PGIGA_G00083390, partial [Pangasianodon gigas]|nr:hypothetical protein [Pangasianodon gigas]